MQFGESTREQCIPFEGSDSAEVLEFLSRHVHDILPARFRDKQRGCAT
jgi:hypothetical protein